MMYIATRKSIPAFKIGTTKSDNFKRLSDLQTKYLYDFNLSESYLVKAKNDKSTIDLEWQLKRDLKEFSYDIDEGNKEGFSEFYGIEALPIVINYIESKAKAFKHLGLTIEKGIKVRRKTQKSHSRRFLDWSSQTKLHDFYEFIKFIHEHKDMFLYFEQFEEEGKTGYLISQNIDFLRELYKNNAVITVPKSKDQYELLRLGLEGYELFRYFDKFSLFDEGKTGLTYGYLQTRIVVNNPSINNYRNLSLREKEETAVNSRMAYFQKVCGKELKRLKELRFT